MHQEKRPVFSRYQIEEQIDLIYEKTVPLKSGGSIFIEPTEALVSIDVNSGKSTGEKSVEDTAFKTNLEAAEEVARQLRLRDLGGLIVIDFIDMREKKHNVEVEKAMKLALKGDKARVNVCSISELGLLEMSRQRIRQTLHYASTLECPHCDGRGKVKSVEAMALSFLRKVHAAAAKGTIGEVVGSLPLEVAYYLLNRKRHELSRIETDYDIEVTVKGKPSYLLNQMELDLVKRESHHQEELPEKAFARPTKEEVFGQEAVAAEGRKKRKKGNAKPQAELVVSVAAAEGLSPEQTTDTAAAFSRLVEPEHPGELRTSTQDENPAEAQTAEPSGEEGQKKRRRKRRRGGKSSHEATLVEVAEEIAESEGGAKLTAEGAIPVPFEPAIAEEKHKKARRSRTRKSLTSEPDAAEAPVDIMEPVKATRKSRTARGARPAKAV